MSNLQPVPYRALMWKLKAFTKASHALPTIAVSLVISAFGWSLGWSGWSLFAVFITILIGQLSVGWSNDAFDSTLDARVGRTTKPTVTRDVSANSLWIAAFVALTIAIVLSWLVAGWLGGSFHVFAILMAWLYNVRLSRTIWSWLPYALAFGAMPAFLSFGFNDQPPTLWSVAVFSIVGVSAHLANALPDSESDTAAGLGGLVVRLGDRRSIVLCWLLLALGSGILASVSFSTHPWIALIVVVTFTIAVLSGSRSRRRSAVFNALLAVVAVDVAMLVVTTALD